MNCIKNRYRTIRWYFGAVVILCLLLGIKIFAKNKTLYFLPEQPAGSEQMLTAAALPTESAAQNPLPTVFLTPTPAVTLTSTPTPTSTPTSTPTPTPAIREKIDNFENSAQNLQKILNSDAFLLVNTTQDVVLYSYRACEALYPASITKLMTAYLALVHGHLEDTVVFSRNAVTPVIPDAMMCGFQEGDAISLHDLLICMLLSSGNDTAVAIAEHISGTEADFVALMNQTALELGMTDTTFCNPHGLPNDAHITTAYDIYLIMEKLFNYDEFLEIVGLPSYTAPYTDKDGHAKKQNVSSTNLFLHGQYQLPEGIQMYGGKTGTTNKAGNCLVIYVSDDAGNCYIAEIFGADTRPELYSDMIQLLKKISD